MTTLHVALQAAVAEFSAAGVSYTVPLGSDTLASHIVSDPPLPEELTNAIGLFMDHLEDVRREVPAAPLADAVEVCGPGLQALADTEAGHVTLLPVDIDRDAAEELFRTLATEPVADRLRNPGLPAGEVHHILGVSCAVVAMLRGLPAPSLTVVAG